METDKEFVERIKREWADAKGLLPIIDAVLKENGDD